MTIFNISVVLFSLITFSSVSKAQDVRAWPCDGCTDVQMENVAKQKGIGTRYVYNLPAGFISEYLVERLDTPQTPIVATPYEPPAWIVDQYLGIHQFYVSNGNVMQGQVAQSVVSGSGELINAYDIVVSSADRNLVANNLANHPKNSIHLCYGFFWSRYPTWWHRHA